MALASTGAGWSHTPEGLSGRSLSYLRGAPSALLGAPKPELKSIAARPPWLWHLPGAVGVCSAVTAGATSSTRFDGVAVLGMASRGEPMMRASLYLREGGVSTWGTEGQGL